MSGWGTRSISDWAAGGDLVVVGGGGDPAFGHPLGHLGPEVGQAVRGRAGEVAQARARLVAQIRPLGPATVPGSLGGVDVVIGLVAVLVEADIVEDEEFELRGEPTGVGQAGRLHVADGLAGDVPGVAGVILLGDRVLDVADHRQGRAGGERVDQRRVRLGDDEQVGLVDRAPADDAGAVEADPLLEGFLGQGVRRDGEMLPDAGEIHEPEVDRRHLALADLRQDLFRCHRDQSFPGGPRCGLAWLGAKARRAGILQPNGPDPPEASD